MGKQEIEKMFLGELPDLRDTQSGKDLINIGKEKGLIEGEIKGNQEALIRIMESKFGEVKPDIRQRIEQTTDVNKLKDLLLQLLKVDTIEQIKW